MLPWCRRPLRVLRCAPPQSFRRSEADHVMTGPERKSTPFRPRTAPIPRDARRTEFVQRSRDMGMNRAVGFLGTRLGQRLAGRDNQRERPVAAMLDNASARPSADTRNRGKPSPSRPRGTASSRRRPLVRPIDRAAARGAPRIRAALRQEPSVRDRRGRFRRRKRSITFKERHCKINSVLRSFS